MFPRMKFSLMSMTRVYRYGYGREGWRKAYPSARTGLAAAAGPRAPPAASGAPGRPCQRREPAPRAAAPPRRAIIRPDTDPRLPSPHFRPSIPIRRIL